MPLHADAVVPVYKPAGEASFHAWQEQYYRYAQPPLDAQVVEVKETEDWRRPRCTVCGASGRSPRVQLNCATESQNCDGLASVHAPI
jgi:hypothetical protein